MRVIIYKSVKEKNYELLRYEEELNKKNIPFQYNLDPHLLTSDDYVLLCSYKKFYLTRLQECSANFKLLNSINNILYYRDKWKSYVIARDNHIQTPFTSLAITNARLKFPIIAKPRFGSMGRDIAIFRNKQDVNEHLWSDIYKTTVFIYQQYLEEAKGNHIRVLVIDGKIFGAIYIFSTDGQISNIARGSSGMKYDLSEQEVDFVNNIIKVFNVNYAGIDILNIDNNLWFLEINGCAHFKGFEATTGLNVAEAVINSLIKE